MSGITITDDEFDLALLEILKGLRGDQLLSIEGVYESLSEHFNNEAITLAESNREAETDQGDTSE